LRFRLPEPMTPGMANIYDLAEALDQARASAPGPQVPCERYAEIFRLFERNPADYGVELQAEPWLVQTRISAFTDRWARPERYYAA
jgi:hypothetical protein